MNGIYNIYIIMWHYSTFTDVNVKKIIVLCVYCSCMYLRNHLLALVVFLAVVFLDSCDLSIIVVMFGS